MGEYDQTSNDEVCRDDNTNADNLSFQLGRSVYPHSSQISLFSGLFVDKKDYPHCRHNHMKKEKKYINGNNNTNNSNNNGHEHGHGHGHGQGKEKEKEKEKEKGKEKEKKGESSLTATMVRGANGMATVFRKSHPRAP